eukprot:GEMP01077304.1.p1 GENE.GEMP01077304.1~~GEMP01077304.1.p1  ORF type:complete len:255 (+),score=33.61 GEMP01077304.1:184-948(+)
MAKLHRSKRHMQVFIENFGPLCREILFSLIDIFNIVLVDGWVNWYRTGDHKSFHHDNYQDRTPRPTITITLSLGCAQTLKFRDARTMEETDDVLMEHGDLLGFDDDFNRKYQHAVSKKDREAVPCTDEVIPDDRFDSRVSFVVWGLPGSYVVPAVLRSNPQEPVIWLARCCSARSVSKIGHGLYRLGGTRCTSEPKKKSRRIRLHALRSPFLTVLHWKNCPGRVSWDLCSWAPRLRRIRSRAMYGHSAHFATQS